MSCFCAPVKPGGLFHSYRKPWWWFFAVLNSEYARNRGHVLYSQLKIFIENVPFWAAITCRESCHRCNAGPWKIWLWKPGAGQMKPRNEGQLVTHVLMRNWNSLDASETDGCLMFFPFNLTMWKASMISLVNLSLRQERMTVFKMRITSAWKAMRGQMKGRGGRAYVLLRFHMIMGSRIQLLAYTVGDHGIFDNQFEQVVSLIS